MTRRNCRSLLLLGAVAAALLLALPALADEIEPEPYVAEDAVEPESEPVVEAEVEEVEVEEEVESKVAKQRDLNFDQLFDLVILRPFHLGATIVGGVFVVPAALVASLGGAENVEDAWQQFVAPSLERTFQSPLGEL
ncbi:MAG: hypothetical protein JRF15_05620 [Deltaproteobacteria bacterium]|jgi:hypothetical protein|nr:hypothetical protein [Deltaproteobacteria bacterium]